MFRLKDRGLPAGLVVETPHFTGGGTGSIPDWLRSSHMASIFKLDSEDYPGHAHQQVYFIGDSVYSLLRN